jgi:hypothetical protein
MFSQILQSITKKASDLADVIVTTVLGTKRDSSTSDEARAPENSEPVFRPHKPIDMTPDPALVRFAELRRMYRAMPERELRAIWDSRESSDLDPGELKAVRAAIREKMGLSTDTETSEELDINVPLGRIGTSKKAFPYRIEETDLNFYSHLQYSEEIPVAYAVEENQSDESTDFYNLFENAEQFQLLYPTDEDGIGPRWDDSGSLANSATNEIEEVLAIPLGSGRYRLAEQVHGPFSCLTIHWGDEFFAILEGENLRMTRMAIPMKFRHYRFIGQTGFGNDTAIAKTVQSLGGGWECVAGGLVTLSVPSKRDAEFRAAMDAIGFPGIAFAITD